MQTLGLGLALRDAVWKWTVTEELEGEVIDDYVNIYVCDRQAAVQALRHEVFTMSLRVAGSRSCSCSTHSWLASTRRCIGEQSA